MAGVGQSAVVFNDAVAVWLLYYYSGNAALAEPLLHSSHVCGSIALRHSLYVDAAEVGVGLDYGCGLRVDGVRYEHCASLFCRRLGHHHGFGGGRSAVIH